MGAFLEWPEKPKETSEGGKGEIEYAVSLIQGWRTRIRDYHFCDPNFDIDTQLYAIIDGFNGMLVEEFVQQQSFAKELKKNQAYKNKDFSTALKETFLRMEVILLTEDDRQNLVQVCYPQFPNKSKSGVTANVTLIHKNTLYVANTGDSRCVLSCSGKSVDLSKEHKAIDLVEQEKRIKAGGDGEGRSETKNQNTLTELEQIDFKGNEGNEFGESWCSSIPDIVVREITSKDEFLLIGCDGILELKTHQEIITLCKKWLADSTPLPKIVEELLDQLIAKDSEGDYKGCDNMSVILVKLQKAIQHQDSDPGDGEGSGPNHQDTFQENMIVDKLKMTGPIADNNPKDNIKFFKPQITLDSQSSFFENTKANINFFSPSMKIEESLTYVPHLNNYSSLSSQIYFPKQSKSMILEIPPHIKSKDNLLLPTQLLQMTKLTREFLFPNKNFLRSRQHLIRLMSNKIFKFFLSKQKRITPIFYPVFVPLYIIILSKIFSKSAAIKSS